MMDEIDDAYTQTELRLDIKTYNCVTFLKTRGYSVLTKSEIQKNTQFKTILITMICMLMYFIGILLGRTL